MQCNNVSVHIINTFCCKKQLMLHSSVIGRAPRQSSSGGVALISLAVTRVWDSVWVIQCHGRSSSSSASSLTALPALFTLWTRASFPARIVKAKVCGKFAELCILGFCGDSVKFITMCHHSCVWIFSVLLLGFCARERLELELCAGPDWTLGFCGSGLTCAALNRTGPALAPETGVCRGQCRALIDIIKEVYDMCSVGMVTLEIQ